ncbi:methyltransferase [Sphingomonas japonica]|uniref:Demethylspheroidene O-methyltransferase n=1 Tax=Sphingomonas japonica TaxID=511662 RepID=A0ABX0U4Y4_9SPHN|nr:methyltransferase [Sphingomonas japonica]NIJ24446.1 demethylspheroidene O-methyltransferase [Sphingomonas japonica]
MSDGWRRALVQRRNRLLADPRFQRFAARFAPTRPVARSEARALFDLVAGFTYSQTLAAFVESGMLAALEPGAMDASVLAEATQLPVEASERLARAAAALRLAERVGTHWMLGSAGAALLGNRGILEMIAHHRLLYADLADPLAALRSRGGGALARYWHYAQDSGQGSADEVAGYSALMAASQPLVADQVIDAYRFGAHRRVLDIGGGEGAFVERLQERHPAIRATVFDLPEVAERARARFAAKGLGGLDAVGGDFLAGELPREQECVTLVRILHDHDADPAARLLRNIRAALRPGGQLVIAEPMAGTPGAVASGDAYFGWYLWAMGSGRPRSPREIGTMLADAGFARSRLLRTQLPITARVVVATA